MEEQLTGSSQRISHGGRWRVVQTPGQARFTFEVAGSIPRSFPSVLHSRHLYEESVNTLPTQESSSSIMYSCYLHIQRFFAALL